ncbi:hypothetical protein U771_11575 [Pseudomonas gorinensis]|uniref:Uncharacterized protein n=1 Tax=Pseudomonas gorinensis TaxID=3240790 RepID=A0ACA7P4G0_9PSED|nr:hypothetical protein U771_11575 [Pseudomonas sp. TKP]
MDMYLIQSKKMVGPKPAIGGKSNRRTARSHI